MSRRFQQRPDKRIPYRRNARQAPGSGATHQIQEHRLGLVVPGVPGGDALRTQVLRQFTQKAIALLPGLTLGEPCSRTIRRIQGARRAR